MNVSDIKFVERLVAGKYPVLALDFFNPSSEFWQTWEKERFDSMHDHLKPGRVLYDIGVCQGWESSVLANFVGARDVVLVEPLQSNWALIKATWQANYLEHPLGTYCGFLSDYDSADATVNRYSWPTEPGYTTATPAEWEKQLNNTSDPICLRLDWLSMAVGAPDYINIDVEGAELLVLKGAETTLKKFKPFVWVSIHPEFMKERFNSEPSELHAFMESLGYTGTLLAQDHEEHWFYEAKS